MSPFTLFSLIFYNFHESNMDCIAVLNCWDQKDQNTFSKMSADRFLFTQFLNIDDPQSLDKMDLNHNRPNLGVFLDFNCNRSAEVLDKVSRTRHFNSRFHWLISDSTANISQFRELFNDLNISVDADITYAYVTPVDWIGNNTAFTLIDVYNNGRLLGGQLNMTAKKRVSCDWNECSDIDYLSDLHLRTKYASRQQLKDISLRASVVLTSIPLNSTEEEKIKLLMSINTDDDIIPRFGFQIVLLAKDAFHCNITLKFFKVWSVTDSKGGSIGALINEEVDILANGVLMSFGRFKYLTPVVATNNFKSVFMFRTPRNSGIQANVFLAPFSPTVWYVFALVLAIAAVLLWCTFCVEQKRLHTYIEFVPSLLSTCLISIGSACSQGSHILPQSFGGRMLFMSLSIITFIVYNYYTSLVVSILLGSPMTSDIKTLGQLADSNLEVALEPLSFNIVYLNTSDLPDVRRFVKRKIENRDPKKVWLPQLEGINRIRKEPGFVYMFECNTGYAVVDRLFSQEEICDLNEVLLRFDQHVYTLVSKKSPYKELQRQHMVRWAETGILKKHRKFYFAERPACFSNSLIITVGLEYTAPLFIMLVCAHVIALLILIMEIIFKRLFEKGFHKDILLHYITNSSVNILN